MTAHKVSTQFHIHVYKVKGNNCLLLSVVRFESRNFMFCLSISYFVYQFRVLFISFLLCLQFHVLFINFMFCLHVK